MVACLPLPETPQNMALLFGDTSRATRRASPRAGQPSQPGSANPEQLRYGLCGRHQARVPCAAPLAHSPQAPCSADPARPPTASCCQITAPEHSRLTSGSYLHLFKHQEINTRLFALFSAPPALALGILSHGLTLEHLIVMLLSTP